MIEDLTTAHYELITALADLRSARRGAAGAVLKLTGARQARATELLDKLTDAIRHCERLTVVVEGDRRQELLTGGQ
jgi:hypothetical protein